MKTDMLPMYPDKFVVLTPEGLRYWAVTNEKGETEDLELYILRTNPPPPAFVEGGA